jgi:hypothetical protein
MARLFLSFILTTGPVDVIPVPACLPETESVHVFNSSIVSSHRYSNPMLES